MKTHDVLNFLTKPLSKLVKRNILVQKKKFGQKLILAHSENQVS
jgi:hypothetical protein